MDLKRIQETISLLEEDKRELDKQKDAIDIVIAGLKVRHGLTAESALPNSSKTTPFTNGHSLDPLSEKQQPLNGRDPNFPRKAPIKEQIVYLFKHHLKEANRYPEIQEAYNKATGTKRFVRDDLMDLRREENPVIRGIKFNRNSNSTYTGLTEWTIEVDGEPRFHPDFFDLKGDKFPKGVTQSEWANLGSQVKEKQEGHPEG